MTTVRAPWQTGRHATRTTRRRAAPEAALLQRNQIKSMNLGSAASAGTTTAAYAGRQRAFSLVRGSRREAQLHEEMQMLLMRAGASPHRPSGDALRAACECDQPSWPESDRAAYRRTDFGLHESDGAATW